MINQRYKKNSHKYHGNICIQFTILWGFKMFDKNLINEIITFLGERSLCRLNELLWIILLFSVLMNIEGRCIQTYTGYYWVLVSRGGWQNFSWWYSGSGLKWKAIVERFYDE